MDTEQITAILKTPGLTVIEGVVYHDIHMYVECSVDSEVIWVNVSLLSKGLQLTYAYIFLG